LISSGLSTFCQRCRHCTSERSSKYSAAAPRARRAVSAWRAACAAPPYPAARARAPGPRAPGPRRANHAPTTRTRPGAPPRPGAAAAARAGRQARQRGLPRRPTLARTPRGVWAGDPGSGNRRAVARLCVSSSWRHRPRPRVAEYRPAAQSSFSDSWSALASPTVVRKVGDLPPLAASRPLRSAGTGHRSSCDAAAALRARIWASAGGGDNEPFAYPITGGSAEASLSLELPSLSRPPAMTAPLKRPKPGGWWASRACVYSCQPGRAWLAAHWGLCAGHTLVDLIPTQELGERLIFMQRLHRVGSISNSFSVFFFSEFVPSQSILNRGSI